MDSSHQTVAQGNISDSAKFLLSPEFAYKGLVALHATEKKLKFMGGFHPISDCLPQTYEWVKFASFIDPENVQIPIVHPLKNTDFEPINLGLMFFNM